MVASRGNTTNPARIPALGLRALALIGAGIVLMYVDHRENHLDGIRKTIGTAVYPVQLVVDAPARVWGWLGESTTSRADLDLEVGVLSSDRLNGIWAVAHGACQGYLDFYRGKVRPSLKL